MALSVVGTQAFIDFVESIKSEGVDLEYRPMGDRTPSAGPMVIEVDSENKAKDLETLDIELPRLTARIERERAPADVSFAAKTRVCRSRKASRPPIRWTHSVPWRPAGRPSVCRAQRRRRRKCSSAPRRKSKPWSGRAAP